MQQNSNCCTDNLSIHEHGSPRGLKICYNQRYACQLKRLQASDAKRTEFNFALNILEASEIVTTEK
jgi:hypothetical protein